MLYNPGTSGKLIEVEQLKLAGASTETDVIAGIGVEYGVQVPSGTLTGTAVTGMPLGNSGTPLGKVYAACTLAAMTFLGGLGASIGATTGPSSVPIIDFDGTLVLYPGTAINFVSTITQSSDIIVCDVVWSEHSMVGGS